MNPRDTKETCGKKCNFQNCILGLAYLTHKGSKVKSLFFFDGPCPPWPPTCKCNFGNWIFFRRSLIVVCQLQGADWKSDKLYYESKLGHSIVCLSPLPIWRSLQKKIPWNYLWRVFTTSSWLLDPWTESSLLYHVYYWNVHQNRKGKQRKESEYNILCSLNMLKWNRINSCQGQKLSFVFSIKIKHNSMILDMYSLYTGVLQGLKDMYRWKMYYCFNV